MVITKSSKLITHRTASKNRERKAMVRSPNSTVQNTVKINRNKAPPLYKINRPNFFKYKCPSRELALIQVLKRDFYSCFEPPSFLDVSTDLFTICCEIEDSLCFEDFSKFDVAVKIYWNKPLTIKIIVAAVAIM